jgi:hypothetical protein
MRKTVFGSGVRDTQATAPRVRRIKAVASLSVMTMFALMVAAAFETSTAALAACAAKVTAEDRDGLAYVKVDAPCRSGERIRATLDTTDYLGQFDSKGSALVVVPVHTPQSAIAVAFEDGTSETVQANFAHHKDVLRVTLEWDAPIDLDLHVLEPGGRLEGPGHLSSRQKAGDLTLGRLELTSDGRATGPFIESYVFPRRIDLPRDTFGAFVEYASRGRVPSGDACGQGQYARIQFTVTIVDHGTVRRQEYEIPPATCGVALQPRAMLIRIQ